MKQIELIEVLKAAGEPTRLRMLCLCARGELTVGEIARVLGQSQPRVSRHLKLLCQAGLLERFREGHWVFYRLPPGGERPELVRTMLARLSPADAGRDPDLKRLDQVLVQRLAGGGAGNPWPGAISLADEGRIRWAVLNLLGDGRIGELLDIGTGSGRMLRLLGARARQAVGVDISNPALAATRAALHAAGLHQCTLRRADMYALPFAESSFDLVTFDEVLAAASRPEEALAEAARVLRPGGRLLVVDVSRGEGRVLDAGVLAAALKRAGLEELRNTPIRVGGASLLLLLARRKRKDAGLAA